MKRVAVSTMIVSSVVMLSVSPYAARADLAVVPSKPLRVLLVRHGAAEQDALTARGVAEARAAGRALKEQDIIAIVASPTRRTRETASIIAGELAVPLIVAEDEAFMVKPGESVEEATTRGLAATRALAQRYAAKTIVIVTHFDVCAALLRQAAGDPMAAPCPRHTLEAPSITEIAVSPDGSLKLPTPSS